MEIKNSKRTLAQLDIDKMLGDMASQIIKSNVKLAKNKKPHKIQDDNQSVNNGVINEKSSAGLRSPT